MTRSVRHFSRFAKCQTLRRGQSTVEAALLLGAVAVALVVFFSFIRASVASRAKGGADTFGHGMLYEPSSGN